MRLPIAILLVSALAAAARGDASEDAVRTRLLRDLGAEAAAVREQAAQRLEGVEGLTPAEIAGALRTAGPRARPLLFRLAAAHRIKELVPDLAAAAAGADAPAAEAAIRALVAFGPEAIAAGRTSLADAKPPVVTERERDARLRHLHALDVQRRVEHEVISRWRRKGGSYRGRYLALKDLGWDAQPVLLAMLLDIPLEDQFIVVPEPDDPELLTAAHEEAIVTLANSRRRGYRTFEPLPPTIEVEELFDLAQQALVDVADLSVMRDVLEEAHLRLKRADTNAGLRARPWEDQFAQEIEVILAARGDKEPLDARRRRLETRVSQHRRWLGRADPDRRAEEFQVYSSHVSELAQVLHQLDLFDEAAERYEEVLTIVSRLTTDGKAPAIAGYNRACALARAGRLDEAVEQLGKALDPAVSTGMEDLTREWVMEDGDLEPLHKDKRFEPILLKRFGPVGSPARPVERGAGEGPGGPGEEK